MIGRILQFRPDAALASAMAGGVWTMSANPRPLARSSAVRRQEPVVPLRSGGPGPPADAEQFRRLMLPHLDGAYDLARYLSRDPSAADDIVQEAYLRAWRGFDGYRGASARSWLYAIVRNCFFSWTRKPAGVPNDPPAMLEGVAAEADDPETALLRRDEAASLRVLIEALPEPFREALVLRELEELSYREIAEVTSAPIGTVMSRLARARRMLCEALGASGTGEASG